MTRQLTPRSEGTPGPSGWLTWRRATALKGIGAAVATFPFALLGLYHGWPVDYRHLDELGRLQLAIGWLTPISAFCFFMFTRTARLFDTPGAEEVLANKESDRWRKNQRIYQNTVEQAVTFAPVLLALAVTVDPGQAQLIPALATLWLLGRVMFYVAYHLEPAYRAFGFDYTLFPSLVAGGWSAAAAIS